MTSQIGVLYIEGIPDDISRVVRVHGHKLAVVSYTEIVVRETVHLHFELQS